LKSVGSSVDQFLQELNTNDEPSVTIDLIIDKHLENRVNKKKVYQVKTEGEHISESAGSVRNLHKKKFISVKVFRLVFFG